MSLNSSGKTGRRSQPGPAGSRWLTDVERKPAGAAPLAALLDTLLQGSIASVSGAMSPASVATATFDWLMHLSMSPGKAVELSELGARQWQRLQSFSQHAIDPDCEPCILPLPQDKRFNDEKWRRWPYNLAAQSFLLAQQWAYMAASGVPGVSRHHADMVTFASRQMLDVLAPSNFTATNPVVA